MNNKLNILYEDNHIIVVVKPYNVLSQGDSTGDASIMDMVKDYIKKKYNKPGNVYLGLVHRLDKILKEEFTIERNLALTGTIYNDKEKIKTSHFFHFYFLFYML